MKSAVTSRYATALIELAEESSLMDKIEKDLNELSMMVGSSADLAALIVSPALGVNQQEAAMIALADKAGFQNMTKSFIGVLVRNRRLNALVSVIDAVNDELSVRRGEVVAEVQTAQKLSDAQAKALQEALSSSIGRSVQLNARVEPSILGGMIVTVGSQMIDDSVARKLERLKGAMSSQANQNISGGDDAPVAKKTKTKSKSTTKSKTKKKEA